MTRKIRYYNPSTILLPMISLSEEKQFIKDAQFNCDISDARDHGVYSMCSMILKLRNLYKWEHKVEPWSEPEPADLLDWVDEKEKYWQCLSGNSYRPLTIAGNPLSPDNLDTINQQLNGRNLFYGSGHGRLMKAVFFLAEILETKRVEGCSVFILGVERVKEMASPFALVQDGIIVIRRESLRYFLWDQIQEMRSSCRSSTHHFLNSYELLREDGFDHQALRLNLDTIVDHELDLFIYHEVGECLQKSLDRNTFQAIIRRFPASVVELVCRAVKDILADTHPLGPLAYIIKERKDASLSLYLGLLDGMREVLFPEIKDGWHGFHESKDWDYIEQARRQGRKNNQKMAKILEEIARMIDNVNDEQLMSELNSRIIQPLGLEMAQENSEK